MSKVYWQDRQDQIQIMIFERIYLALINKAKINNTEQEIEIKNTNTVVHSSAKYLLYITD